MSDHDLNTVPPVADDIDRLEREREQAIEWTVHLEGELAHVTEERDEYLEALRGATARVFDERRKILPLRLERDSLTQEARYLRRRLEHAERKVIALEEVAEQDRERIAVLEEALAATEETDDA